MAISLKTSVLKVHPDDNLRDRLSWCLNVEPRQVRFTSDPRELEVTDEEKTFTINLPQMACECCEPNGYVRREFAFRPELKLKPELPQPQPS